MEPEMRLDQIRQHALADPFRPFRIYVSDGSHYDIDHPNRLWVTRHVLYVARYLEGQDVPEDAVFFDYRHITRLEILAHQS